MIFFDTETIGFHGPTVLIQWAEDDRPINLHSVWTTPAHETLSLIEKFVHDKEGIVGFNLAFDWFHLCQTYTVLSLFPDKDIEPQDCIELYAELEPLGRDGPCLKPVSACDVMLHARKGPYQSTMDRGDIRIKRVPTQLAWQLAGELERRVPLKDIYFARRKDKFAPKWQIYDVEDADGNPESDFKDIVLKFAPSSALKALAVDALGVKDDEILLFGDVEVNPKLTPVEFGYAPFARAVGDRRNWKGAWPERIEHYISHWAYGTLPRKYAAKDVEYTRSLYKYFGSPALGDNDSILACMVGAVRWKGFRVNLEGLKQLRDKVEKSKTKIVDGKEFKIPTAPEKARIYVSEVMDEVEKLGARASAVTDFGISTKRVLLEEIAKWKTECPECNGSGTKYFTSEDDHLKTTLYEVKCEKCANGLVKHPAAIRAQEVLDARQANYQIDLYNKFITAGRFHASFAIIGALSNRMSGSGGDLNPQGVSHTKDVRSQFPLAWPGQTLCAGDYAGFEVTLAEACYGDPDLRKDLLSGKKIHALFGVHVFPNMTYEEILATAGTSNDIYDKCKKAVFAIFYGGEGYTLANRLGVDIEIADKALEAFGRKYPKVGAKRQEIWSKFAAMKQPGGIGSKVEWHTPADYQTTMFDFRRYFTLENTICKALYELATKPPKDWTEFKTKVRRRNDRVQTTHGAVQTALFACAFALQSGNCRAASNHEIQSAGATITKLTQRKIWDIQPPGIGEWIVQPMNIHDEIQCPTKPGYEKIVEQVVNDAVESVRPKVPLIKIDWQTGLKSWADK